MSADWGKITNWRRVLDDPRPLILLIGVMIFAVATVLMIAGGMMPGQTP
jgi:hypothetical protein